MRGKHTAKQLGWRVFGWALVITVVLLMAGGIAYKQSKRPKLAQIEWEYPLSAWQVISRGEPNPNGGVVLCGRDRLDFIDRQGNAYAVIQAQQHKKFMYSHFELNHFDSQGNYYICIDDSVCSYDLTGHIRWEVHLDQQSNTDCSRFGRPATCRVSENDHVLVVYYSDEFAILNIDGEILHYLALPFVTIIDVDPIETANDEYLLGINRENTNDTIGIAVIDVNGELQWQIRTFTAFSRDVSLYDSTIIISDRNSMTYAYDLSGNLKWQCSTPANMHESRHLQAIRLSGTSEKLLCVDSDNYSKLTCITLDGDRLWSVKLPGIRSMVSKSENVQYVITHQDPSNSVLGKTLEKLNRNLAYQYSSSASSNLLVELTDGEVSKRWVLPFEPSTISIGRDGELYVTSSNEQKLYCIIPD